MFLAAHMTIRQKLTLYWAAVLAAILVIAACSVFVIFSRQQWGALDAALMEEADTSGSAIARLDASAAALIVRRLSQERDLGPGKRVRLIAGNAVLADFGSPGADFPGISDGLTSRGVFDGRRGVYRFAVMPLSIEKQDALLEDGVDATPVRNSIARLRTILLVMTPLLFLVSVAGGYWLAGRSLAPIISLAGELARINPKELGRRLPAGEARDEVARLAMSINALMDRLEAASLTERRFVSDAAHELRTPLAVLRTGLEVTLNRERGAREQHEALQSALREVVALCTTAEELLALARLSEEAFEQRAPVNFGALVREVLDAVEPLVQAKNLSLNANVAEDLIVDGNRDQLRRLVVNLLDNAIKFTPENGRVAVALNRQGERAVVRVSDSGLGIAPADLPLIFERFFRGAAAKTAGSGLGLSLCKEIVRLQGGEIFAANNPAGGCELVVAMPLRTGQAAALERA
ncbi:MAG TPA: HAMP domain-containing sensor histidine kinase [Candidatus Binataceae bacterium]|jgi:two-component system OmpR family sensor kinase|nr:HAMP domain-containing sensor histidine kinase [Candidatus Binataceae bacterium]